LRRDRLIFDLGFDRNAT